MTGFIEGLTTGQLFMAIFTVMTLLFMGSMLAIEMAWDRREHLEVRRNLERMVAEQDAQRRLRRRLQHIEAAHDDAGVALESIPGVSTDSAKETM